jgi:hypothetical protein
MRFFPHRFPLVPFSFASIMSLAIFVPFTVDALAQERCKTDKDEALVEAISYHRQIGLAGADEKDLWGDARKRAEWCPEEKNARECTAYFKEKAQQYVDGLRHSALILYARESDTMCAFLFKPGGPMQYARRQVKDTQFDDDIEHLRAAYTGVLGRSVGAERQKRLAALRSGTCVLQSLPVETTPEASLEPATSLAPDETSLEMQVSDRLFPSEFHEALNGVEHLSVIPFGAITTLPIGALRPFADDRQTVDLFTVNYLLFAGEVARKAVKWGPPTEPLIFGNPLPKNREEQRARCIASLPEAENEASQAHVFFGGTYLPRDLATKRAFTERAAQADMIYFAAHGLAGLENGISDSFIAMADENLTARDIQNISSFKFNKTRLVVMSACQTGLGRIQQFGVIGLARTFLDAGAENTVMSLWNVSDKATSLLMSEFNSQLRRWPPAEALQIAQIYLRQKTIYNAPVFWAGFAVYGNQMLTSENADK